MRWSDTVVELPLVATGFAFITERSIPSLNPTPSLCHVSTVSSTSWVVLATSLSSICHWFLADLHGAMLQREDRIRHTLWAVLISRDALRPEERTCSVSEAHAESVEWVELREWKTVCCGIPR